MPGPHPKCRSHRSYRAMASEDAIDAFGLARIQGNDGVRPSGNRAEDVGDNERAGYVPTNAAPNLGARRYLAFRSGQPLLENTPPSLHHSISKNTGTNLLNAYSDAERRS
jgi:hypothetical protein